MSSTQQNKLNEEVNHVIKVLGDDHILCIIANLQGGGMRFNELQRVLKLNPVTLTDRLNKLENEGLIVRQTETVDKISVVYELTKKGEGMMPIVSAFEIFAKKFSLPTHKK